MSVSDNLVDSAVDLLSALSDRELAMVFMRVPGFQSRTLQGGVVKWTRKVKLTSSRPSPVVARRKRRGEQIPNYIGG